MTHARKKLGLLGAALIGSVAFSNAFAVEPLPQGYQLADAKTQGEGKCGEGKCGEGKAKHGEGKCGEGKCGDDKAKKGEGKCGEGKCGEKPKA